MDLDHRGRADLAHRFLNAYLEHTGDYAALAVLSFYLVYRALVRAKVAPASRGAGGADRRERVAQRRRAPSRARRKVRRAARHRR
jgi:aminoglycoside phosphotransferase family enzyme